MMGIASITPGTERSGKRKNGGRLNPKGKKLALLRNDTERRTGETSRKNESGQKESPGRIKRSKGRMLQYSLEHAKTEDRFSLFKP